MLQGPFGVLATRTHSALLSHLEKLQEQGRVSVNEQTCSAQAIPGLPSCQLRKLPQLLAPEERDSTSQALAGRPSRLCLRSLAELQLVRQSLWGRRVCVRLPW